MFGNLVRRGPVSQRSETRQTVQIRAQIVSETGTMDCLIKDKSKRGARLKVDNIMAVPPQFDLTWLGTQRRPVQVRWRRRGEIGVAFVERRDFGRRGSN